jgi:hypothetical protein
MREHEGWAIFPVPESDGVMCYTSAPPIAGHKGLIWQIYNNERDAKDWLRIKFSDAKYKIVKVLITETE